jgi:hypothetical protein
VTNYKAIEANKPFETTEGAHPSVRVNVLKKLPRDRHLLALKRLRKVVEQREQGGYNCSDVGAKNTECNWGMCQQNKVLWPDQQDYIWPHNENRVAPLEGSRCPLDTGLLGHESWGCFYRCQYFSKKLKMPTRDEVLARIDEMIVAMGKTA